MFNGEPVGTWRRPNKITSRLEEPPYIVNVALKIKDVLHDLNAYNDIKGNVLNLGNIINNKETVIFVFRILLP